MSSKLSLSPSLYCFKSQIHLLFDADIIHHQTFVLCLQTCGLPLKWSELNCVAVLVCQCKCYPRKGTSKPVSHISTTMAILKFDFSFLNCLSSSLRYSFVPNKSYISFGSSCPLVIEFNSLNGFQFSFVFVGEFCTFFGFSYFVPFRF
jgi:hypothetical protein